MFKVLGFESLYKRFWKINSILGIFVPLFFKKKLLLFFCFIIFFIPKKLHVNTEIEGIKDPTDVLRTTAPDPCRCVRANCVSLLHFLLSFTWKFIPFDVNLRVEIENFMRLERFFQLLSSTRRDAKVSWRHLNARVTLVCAGGVNEF